LMEAKGKDNVVIENLDDALPYVGELGKYQIILISIMALATLVAGFPVLIMFFAGQNPPWQCETNSTICKLNGTFKSGAKNYEARCSMPRSEWKFTKPIDYSIVTQYDLYCDTEHLIYLATSLLFVGWGIGSVIFGWLADRYGRFKVLVVSVCGIVVISFLSAFSPNFAIFAVCRFVVGLFKPGTVVGAYVVAGELLGPKYRPAAGTIMWILFSVSLVLTGVKAYFIREWKILMIACSAPYVFVCFLVFFVPESMRWLRLQGRHADVIKILKKAAKVNGKVLPDGVELKPLQNSNIEKSKTGSVLDLFRPLRMLLFSTVQGFGWFVSASVYYGVSWAVSDMSGEMYRDYILAMLIEIPALLLSVYAMNKFGRKKTVISTLALAGLFCSIVGGMSDLEKKSEKLRSVKIVFGLLGKFSITCSFNSFYMWSLEIYPTCIRGEGMGFLQITARVGSALAPWLAKWLKVFHGALPFSLMGGLSLTGAALLLTLPDTKGRATFETIDQLLGLVNREKNGSLIVQKNTST